MDIIFVTYQNRAAVKITNNLSDRLQCTRVTTRLIYHAPLNFFPKRKTNGLTFKSSKFNL